MIQRYEHYTEYGNGGMETKEDGEYVLYKDFTEQMATEIKRRWVLEDEVNSLNQKIIDLVIKK